MAEKVTYTLEFKDRSSVTIEELTGKIKKMGGEIHEVAENSLGNLAQKMANWNLASDAIGKVSNAIKGLVAPSAAFDTEMRKANTMMGLSTEEFDDMKSKVRELSLEVPMAGDALAKGLYQVISTGTPASEAIDMLRVSARASVGGIADLEKVVGVTATVLKNYGLQGGEAAQMIQDKIQLTAKNGVTSFEQLSDALPKVAGNASTLGVSIDELMATFSTLTGVSGNTAEVSTQLSAIFTSLIKPSSEASKMAEAMGIQFDAAAIKAAGGMSNFLADLKTDVASFAAQNGMLESEIYASLFGSAEAVRALTPLQGELADKFVENIGLMKDSAGTIDEAFNIMGEASESQMQAMANHFAQFTDFINDHFGFLANGISGVMDMFSQIGGVLPVFEAIGKTAAWNAVQTKLNATWSKVAAVGTNMWAGAQRILNMTILACPIGWIIAGIAAVVAIVADLASHWQSITDAFTNGGIIAGIKRIGVVLLDLLLYPLQKLLELLSYIPGLGYLAQKGADAVHGWRESLNLTENEEKTDKAIGEATGDVVPGAEMPTATSGGAIKTGVGKVAAATSDKGGQIKNININIDKVVEQFTVSTTNIRGDMGEIKNMIAKALVDAVNDVNYAI